VFVPNDLPIKHMALYFERLKDRAVTEAEEILKEETRNKSEVSLELIGDRPDETADLLSLFAQAEAAAELHNTIHLLSSADIEILDLAAQGLSHIQMSEQLHIAPAAARKRLERARERLRRLMGTE
jgi:DNA-directed RNA polymerase specialized sigma24 family protein